MKMLLPLLLVCGQLMANALQDAYSLLHQNKRTEAKAVFEQLAKSPQTAADAYMGLTLLEINNSHFSEAFGYFSRFFETAENPYPYVYALWGSGVFSASDEKGRQTVIDFMSKLSSDSKANATLQSMAFDYIAGRLMAQNKLKESKEVYQQLSDVLNWSTVGTFENMSASGFNKDYEALAHPEPGYVFHNQHGVPVQWFAIPDARYDRWLDLKYHYETGDAITYSQTFLQSDADREVLMMLGVSGSVKVWMNDFMVFSEQEERNTNMDVFQCKVKLQKGTNRILIQLGSSEIDNMNFMLRFTSPDGKLLPRFTSSAAYQSYTKAQPYETKTIALFSETFFEQKQKAHPSFADELMLVNVYNLNDNRYAARKMARELKERYPQSTIVSEALIETYIRDKNETDRTRELEFIRTNDPESLYGLVLKYNDAFEKEDYEEAGKLLQRRIALYGANADTESKLLQLMARKQEVEPLLKELDQAYKTYPDASTFTYMRYNILNATKDQKKANEVLEEYLKKWRNEDMLETLANSKLENGKKAEGLNMYKRMLEDFPGATMRYTKLADKYYAMQQYDEALQWQQKAIGLAPYVGSFYASQATMYEAAGKKEQAKTALRKAIELTPSDYSSRRKLREMEGRKDLFGAFATVNIDSIVKNSPKADAYPNDNSMYLLRDKQQVVYPGNGAMEERNEILIKVFNQSGIDVWKELSLPYNGYSQRLVVEKAELLKKDGGKVAAETNGNEVVCSSLEVGDVIHVAYKLETATSGKLSEHFWEDFNFNNGYPVGQARYSLLVPTQKKFKYKLYNTQVAASQSQLDDYQLYVWQKKNMPAIESEAFMPAFADVAERVVVSSIPDWNYVANWYSDLSGVKTKADFEVKEKVKELFAGKSNLSEINKARVIYNYIQENFNYSNIPFLHSALTPQRASRTLRARLGDCKDLSVLFVAMCREVGLNTNLVLVDTRDNGDSNVDLPTIGFNHCIAQLNTKEGKRYLVELTDNHLPFGAMYNNLIHANGLVIPAEVTPANSAKLTPLDTKDRSENNIQRITTLTINNLQAEIARKNKRRGAEVSGMRSTYRDKGESDRKKILNESLSSEFNKKVTLKALQFQNLDNLADTLQMNYDFTVEGYTSELMGMRIFRLPWSDSYNSLDFVSLAERKFPMNIWAMSTTRKDREEITLLLPAGKKMADIPKPVTLSHPAMTYSLTYKILPDRMIAVREVHYLKEQIGIAEYDSFKEIIAAVNEADQRQYGIK